jgi:hypothetical protein
MIAGRQAGRQTAAVLKTVLRVFDQAGRTGDQTFVARSRSSD